MSHRSDPAVDLKEQTLIDSRVQVVRSVDSAEEDKLYTEFQGNIMFQVKLTLGVIDGAVRARSWSAGH